MITEKFADLQREANCLEATGHKWTDWCFRMQMLGGHVDILLSASLPTGLPCPYSIKE